MLENPALLEGNLLLEFSKPGRNLYLFKQDSNYSVVCFWYQQN